MPRSMDAAEVIVCSRVVSFAKELSLFDVIFEGDSRWVVQDINNKGVNLTLYGHVIKEIHYVCSILHRTSFQHVTRGGGGNKLAYALARQAISSTDIDVWVEELPNDLDDVLQLDLIH